MRQHFQHFQTADPSTEWKRGIGWFFRLQGIITSIAVDVAGAIASFTLAHWSVGIVVLGLGICLACVLLVIRHFRLQRLNSDQSLHSFFHYSRDDIARKLTDSIAGDRAALDAFHCNTAQRIADFFRQRLGDKNVCCAVRLAEEVNGSKQYATVARSDRMETTREKNSEPIPANKGIAEALLQYEQHGVVVIDDILEMTNDSRWFETKNDRLGDVRSLMISPINGWEGDTKVMIGMLFVSSKTPQKLKAGDTLPMKAFADFLGFAYPTIFTVHGGASSGGK